MYEFERVFDFLFRFILFPSFMYFIIMYALPEATKDVKGWIAEIYKTEKKKQLRYSKPKNNCILNDKKLSLQMN